MTTAGKHARDTRSRLLESACDAFAEKGYRDATIAEICEQAGANIAAVNYYFRDKDTLYSEAWRLAFHRSLKAHPPDGGVPEDAPAEERLHGRILSIMQRIVDPKSHEFDIAHKEMANPTGLLAEVMRESIEPIRLGFISLVRELLGERASDEQVLLCQMSIRAQCFALMVHERLRKKSPNGPQLPTPPLPDLGVETIADHVTRFCLAGIREVRRQIENGEFEDRE